MCKQITITSLEDDIAAVNAQREFRKRIKSTQFSKYGHNWWQTTLALLTLFPDGTHPAKLVQSAAHRLNMNMNVFGNLLIRAIDGYRPDDYLREYSKSLPAIVRKIGLRYRRITQSEAATVVFGRPPKYVFFFREPEAARKILVSEFPEMLELFAAIQRSDSTI